jgi:AraC family transcriptional regulator
MRRVASGNLALKQPAPAERLDRLAPGLLERWHGLPVRCLGTPEGTWRHRFTPDKTAIALLDTGSLGSRVDIRGRSADLDVEAGALALFAPGIEVKVHQLGSAGAGRILVDLDLEALPFRTLFDDGWVTAPLRPSADFRDPALASVMREMAREIGHGCPNGTLFAESLSVGLALHLYRTRAVRPPRMRERGKLSAWQWTRVDELITSELASDLSLAALAESVGLSKPQFVRLFRNTAGTSPHRYVVQRRVERARQLIQSSRLPLIDVAAEVGFASQSHLNRMFHEAYGMTPGDARKPGPAPKEPKNSR